MFSQLIALLVLLVFAAIVYWIAKAVGLPHPIPFVAALLVFLLGCLELFRGAWPGRR